MRLRRNRRSIVRWVKELAKTGIMCWKTHARCSVGMFCVDKKGCRQRLILDARLVNAILRAPPHVALATSETMSRFEYLFKPGLSDSEREAVIADNPVHFGISDVSDCSHRLIMSEPMSPLLCLNVVLRRRS